MNRMDLNKIIREELKKTLNEASKWGGDAGWDGDDGEYGDDGKWHRDYEDEDKEEYEEEEVVTVDISQFYPKLEAIGKEWKSFEMRDLSGYNPTEITAMKGEMLEELVEILNRNSKVKSKITIREN